MFLDAFDSIQDSWADWAIIFGVLFVAYLAVVWLAATYWTYKDIGARTRDQAVQVLMVLLVFVFFLPGLLLYLIIRPKLTLAERYDRNLEAEALLRELQEEPACPFCRRKIAADFLACPYCRTTLGVPCDSCARVLSFSWVICPFCGADRAQPELAPAPALPALEPTSALPSLPPAEGLPARPTRPRRAPTARYTPSAQPEPAPAAPPPAADAALDTPS